MSKDLLPGDLVFFKTGWKTRHVGIYVGQGDFVHASQTLGVTRSSLSHPYWSKHYWMSRRIYESLVTFRSICSVSDQN